MEDLRRGLPLDGWGDRSIWGYDTGMAAFFAQLWRDDCPDDQDKPQFWITPLSRRWPTAIEGIDELALAIGQATGRTYDQIADAMCQSAPDVLYRIRATAE